MLCWASNVDAKDYRQNHYHVIDQQQVPTERRKTLISKKKKIFDSINTKANLEFIDWDKRVKSREKNGWSRISTKQKFLLCMSSCKLNKCKPNIFGRCSADFFNVLLTKSCASSLNEVGSSYFSCVTLFKVPWTAKSSIKWCHFHKIKSVFSSSSYYLY